MFGGLFALSARMLLNLKDLWDDPNMQLNLMSCGYTKTFEYTHVTSCNYELLWIMHMYARISVDNCRYIYTTMYI